MNQQDAIGSSQNFQISAIQGCASFVGLTSMEYIKEILGDKVKYLENVQDLTMKDASEVLDAARRSLHFKEMTPIELSAKLFDLDMRLQQLERQQRKE